MSKQTFTGRSGSILIHNDTNDLFEVHCNGLEHLLQPDDKIDLEVASLTSVTFVKKKKPVGIWTNEPDYVLPGDILIEDLGKSTERNSGDGARIFRVLRPSKDERYDHEAEIIGVGHICEMGTKP